MARDPSLGFIRLWRPPEAWSKMCAARFPKSSRSEPWYGVHQLLAESNPQKRREWIAALDRIESLKPGAVIAGHKQPGNEDSPRILEESRQYIRDFDGIAKTATTARELYDQMVKLHPLRMNVNALWTSARDQGLTAVMPKSAAKTTTEGLPPRGRRSRWCPRKS